MNIVVPFPQDAVAVPQRTRKAPRSVTLFMHVRRATLIAHLAQPKLCAPETGGERVGKK